MTDLSVSASRILGFNQNKYGIKKNNRDCFEIRVHLVTVKFTNQNKRKIPDAVMH